MKNIVLSIFFFMIPVLIFAQHHENQVYGTVNGEDDEKIVAPLVGVNIYWAGSTIGTVTDINGHFHLEKQDGFNQLVFSFVGYRNDTINAAGQEQINVTLRTSVLLDEVKIVHRKKSTNISLIDPLKVEKIGEGELLKAACCNLSESFETSPSVDVSFTDAVTGTRQIMLLGLAGPYTQITRESMPDIRGLSSIFGLTYIPGSWIEGIQLSKGTGTVANGFESIAGQINVELRKPEEAERVYLNMYANEEGRLEANANFAHKFKHDWSTGLLLHASNNKNKIDRNSDGFLDNPLGSNIIGLHRWKFHGHDGLEFQAGIKGTLIDKVGGQVNFNPLLDEQINSIWGMQLKTERIEGWTKIGKVNMEKTWQSIGLQLSGLIHNQESSFGLNNYDAKQNSFYANLLYQDIFFSTNHKFRTGASFQYDDYAEELNDTIFERKEVIPGIFFEYTINYLEKFNIVTGLRADHHNLFGLFFSPRIHLRYAPLERTVLRASVGRGQKTNNIFAENNGLFASSRQFEIMGDHEKYPYGLKPEVAWSYGGSFTQAFRLDYREGNISIDFFRTDFVNQVIVDLDEDPQRVVFYNLEGKSYSNSFQAQIDYEILKRLDGRLAYRWYDVKTTYNHKLLQKPLVAKHRTFMNLAYNSRSYWKFDFTVNWQGEKRIPFTASNPSVYRLKEYSPDFFLVNSQVSKMWREKFEVYLGVENLLNYKQKNPIIANESPFSNYFDSSLIWGPIMGRNVYAGLRLRIK